MKILFLQLEFSRWYKTKKSVISDDIWVSGRSAPWSYSANLAFEDGFKFNNIDYTTLLTPIFPYANTLCQKEQFDQVWFEIGRHNYYSENWLNWLSEIAPVRVGIIQESSSSYPGVFNRIKYCTHVLVGDENDEYIVTSTSNKPAMWIPAFIPSCFIESPKQKTPRPEYACFSGTLYKERMNFINNGYLKKHLRFQRSPEKLTPYPSAFNLIHRIIEFYIRCGLKITPGITASYLHSIRSIRKICFKKWLNSLQNGCATVNLPSEYKAYPGRVIESMAVGQPVISARIQNRPRTNKLFIDGEDILLYNPNQPSDLLKKIKIIQKADIHGKITENAQIKIKENHTAEIRVKQILEWIKSN
jgi:hypothetical protein